MPSLHSLSLRAAAAVLCALASLARAAPAAPDLDLTIRYYNELLTAEGVVNQSRYEETMLRRQAHVWVERVRPAALPGRPATARPPASAVQGPDGEQGHKHFNYVTTPRHVSLEHGQVKLEFVDAREQMVVAIPPAEYDNVNFDGSWANAFYLLDPQELMTLPLSSRPSSVAGARWREREVNGIYQRVLWDERRQIPLTVESGDLAGRFFRRVEIVPRAGLSAATPWRDVQGYAHKDYADFLD